MVLKNSFRRLSVSGGYGEGLKRHLIAGNRCEYDCSSRAGGKRFFSYTGACLMLLKFDCHSCV